MASVSKSTAASPANAKVAAISDQVQVDVSEDYLSDSTASTLVCAEEETQDCHGSIVQAVLFSDAACVVQYMADFGAAKECGCV